MVLVLILFLALSHPAFAGETGVTGAHPPSHELWDSLMKGHVSANGRVDYEGIKEDRESLKKYLDLLADHPPEEGWPKEEQMAYWINAYNAFTIELILRNWPVRSIRDIRSPWKQKFIRLGANVYHLDDIEHEILRARFKDPRVHFAIVCASYSCPPLRNEAYTGRKLDEQLNDQGRRFINDPKYNKISADDLRISKLFYWYRKDFPEATGLIRFLNQYATVKANPTARISYLEYNWSLNN